MARNFFLIFLSYLAGLRGFCHKDTKAPAISRVEHARIATKIYPAQRDGHKGTKSALNLVRIWCFSAFVASSRRVRTLHEKLLRISCLVGARLPMFCNTGGMGEVEPSLFSCLGKRLIGPIENILFMLHYPVQISCAFIQYPA